MSSSDDNDGSSSSLSKDLLEPTQDEAASASAEGSSAGWNPDGDGSPDHDAANTSLPSASSTTASKSRKRKRSKSNASSSLGWNPDDNDDGDSAEGVGSEDGKPSQLPSQIDIGGSSNDEPNSYDENDASSDIEKVKNLDTATFNGAYTKPPERIRYQMLGAPTLLYRHAPSYLDPTNRPSTLTPQQLSMALYMNQHPIKDWFKGKQSSLHDASRKRKATSTKHPLLNSTCVPQHPRPWGRPHDWDWRHTNAEISESKVERNLKRQAELDAYNMANELHDSNKEKARNLWEDIVSRNKRELPSDGRDQSERILAGFNVFCSEYIDQLKQSTSQSIASSFADGPQHHFAWAMKAWNELSREEQSSYEKRAVILNQTSKTQDDSKVEGTEDAIPKKKTRMGRTTGFNIFRSEYMQSNAMPEPGTGVSRKNHLFQMTKKAGAVWKEMAEEEKSVYKEKANIENARRATPSSPARTVATKTSTIASESKGGSIKEQPSVTGRANGFHVFRSEYAEFNPLPITANAADRKAYDKTIRADWKRMDDSEKNAYKMIAKLQKEDGISTQKNEVSQNNKPKQSEQSKKQSRKGQTTGFNVFRLEYMQSNTDGARVPETNGKDHLLESSKIVGRIWKEMSEEEKCVYIERAQLENDILADFIRLEEADDTEEKSGGEFNDKQPSKSRLHGYHVFLSEYKTRWTELNPSASSADRKLSMFKCQEEARADWKKLSANERSVYQEKAKSKNRRKEDLTTQSKPNGREGMHSGFNAFRSENMKRLKEIDPLPVCATTEVKEAYFKRLTEQTSQHWKSMSQAEKERFKEDAKRAGTLTERKGKVNGFNIFQAEYMNQFKDANPLHDGANAEEKKAYFKKLREQTSQQWSSMAEDEKSLYKQNAARRNSGISPIRSAAGTEEVVDGSISSSSLDDDIGSDDTSHNDNASINSASEAGDYREQASISNPNISSSLEEQNMCPDYFAPFSVRDTGFGFHLNSNMSTAFGGMENGELFTKQDESGSEDDESQERKKRVTKPGMAEVENTGESLLTEETSCGANDLSVCQDLSEDHRQGLGGPSGYGNCLWATTCHCLHCGQKSPSWFLMHPSGENMSSLAVSKLNLPCDSSSVGEYKITTLDIGDKILQISQCGATLSSSESTGQVICLVVRTSSFCSVIYAKSAPKTPLNPNECSAEFCLREEARIDLRAPLGSIRPSYLPIYSTCDPNSTVSHFACQSFTILSRDYSGNCTTIHRVSLRKEPEVKVHSLAASLSDISLIEFVPHDRMALWAAARSQTLPTLSTGFFKARSAAVVGYGHSLFQIDLRNNSSTFVWSPSHADYLTETLYSISGIKADALRDHTVWVASSSACKVWALDVRYKAAKVVVSWSLPSLSNDLSLHMPVTGVFGGGVLMSQPLSPNSKRDNALNATQPPVLFSLNKDPNSHAVNVLQFPSAMPRLQARPLESAGFQEVSKLKYNVASIARSSIFPLPDVSSNVFNVGLATLECSSASALKKKHLDRLGYDIPPANVTYIITMTSLGDMYCHSLLATNAMEETQTHQFGELPVGMKAISIPGKEVKRVSPGLSSSCLRITLSNEFPVPSSSISPFYIADTDKCAKFKSFDIASVLAANEGKSSALAETLECTDLVQECKIPRTLHGLRQPKSELTFSWGGNVERFKVAQRNTEEYITNHTGDDADEKIPLQHSLPKFGLLQHGTKDNNFPVSVYSSHLQVVASRNEDTNNYETDDASSAFDNGPRMELGLNLLKRLQSQYMKEATN